MYPDPQTILDRLLNAVWGALIAAFTAAGIMFWTADELVTDFLVFSAIAGALLGFALGRTAIDWLKIAFERVWW